jgi:hypothetical protein
MGYLHLLTAGERGRKVARLVGGGNVREQDLAAVAIGFRHPSAGVRAAAVTGASSDAFHLLTPVLVARALAARARG